MEPIKSNKVNRIDKIKSSQLNQGKSIKSSKVNKINQKVVLIKQFFWTLFFLFSSIYIEGTKTKSSFLNYLYLNKITLRHKLKNFDASKSRFERCLKFALKMLYLTIKTQNNLRQRFLPLLLSIYYRFDRLLKKRRD